MNLIYAGSFDPITKGHLNIIQRASKMCDTLYIYVANNPNKNHKYHISSRKKMILDSCYNLRNIYILDDVNISTAMYAKSLNAKIVRGLRNCTDLDYEMSLYNINKDIADIDTIFIPCDNRFGHISSSMVKVLLNLDITVNRYVPEEILEYL